MRTGAAVVAQAWRDGSRQADLAKVLGGVDVVALDLPIAKRVGTLLGEVGGSDVADARVARLVGPVDTVSAARSVSAIDARRADRPPTEPYSAFPTRSRPDEQGITRVEIRIEDPVRREISCPHDPAPEQPPCTSPDSRAVFSPICRPPWSVSIG